MAIPLPPPRYTVIVALMDTPRDPLDELLAETTACGGEALQPLQSSRVLEPPMSRGSGVNPSNPYEGRWRWWYSAIADYMIRNPSGTMADCARALSKGANTISMIVHTDLFQSYLQQRKTEWARDHDHALRSRLTETAMKSLDLTLDVLQRKGDQVPLQRLVAITESSLDRLGYAPSSTTVILDQSRNDNRSQTLNVSGSQLLEAREAMRAAEAARAGKSLPASPPPEATEVGSATILEDLGDFGELEDASLSRRS